MNLKKAEKQSEGQPAAFDYLLDEAAFIDRVVLNRWGIKRSNAHPPVWEGTLAIGGAGRMYSRSLHTHCLVSRNPVELRYGNFSGLPNLAPFRLILRSESTPLSLAQVMLVGERFFRQGFHAEVSLVEVTFDTSQFSIPYFSNRIVTRARSRQCFADELGRRTQYVGRTRSPWQLRIYQRTPPLHSRPQILRCQRDERSATWPGRPRL